MNMKAFLGIDPGATGAAALLPLDGLPLLFDFPNDLALCAEQLRTWRLDYRIELCAIEAQTARPGQGVSSMLKLGMNFGGWLGILHGLSIPFILARAQQWQAGLFNKADGADIKRRSLTAARRAWPDCELHLAKHHGRADSLHLAAYARRWANGAG
jgi:hypothetical protein